MIVSWINYVWVLAFSSSQKHIIFNTNSEKIQAQNCSVYFLDNFSFTAKQEQLQNSKIRDDQMIFTQFISWFMWKCWHIKTIYHYLLTADSSQLLCQKTSTDIRHHEKMRIHHSERSDESSHSACSSEMFLSFIFYFFYMMKLLETCNNINNRFSISDFINNINLLAYDLFMKWNYHTLMKVYKKYLNWIK